MLPLRDTIQSRHYPVVTVALIWANALVFLFQLSLTAPELERFFLLYGVVPARFTHPFWAYEAGFPPPTPWPLLTSVFLHGGWFHIISNMWTLWIFGDNVEDRMGSGRFLLFYLLCGAMAGLLHILTNVGSAVPTIGASGAIAGVMGAYFCLFPRSLVITLVPILFYPLVFEIPAVIYLGVWFFSQVLNGVVAHGQAAGVAWWAHIGGFVAGMFFYRRFLNPARDPGPGPLLERHYVPRRLRID